MKILAIETSCDDTGIAILDANKSGDLKVLSNVISSQIEIHKQYGGVFPAMAKREHQRNSIPVLIDALKQAELLNPKSKIPNTKQALNIKSKTTIEKILEREPELLKRIVPFFKKYKKPDIDFIAVTNGPGLEPCLWVGVNLAKVLSYFWDIPIIATNHIESHILVNLLPKQLSSASRQILNGRSKSDDNVFLFPAIALVVSGGHTQIILVEKIGKYKILGETRDDAAGECFDKAAKILGLDYPGGPIISKLAEKAYGCPTSVNLPRPMINTKDYDFSFSGLKTAILYHHQKQNKKTQKDKQYIADMCAEIQQAIIDVLIKKTVQAAKDYNAKTIILGGGVSANHELKTQLLIKLHQDLPNVELLFPQIDHSTDNGLMTAITGYFHKNKKASWETLKADANLRISD